ncbi:DBF4-type zinc finger-containing protein 2 [Galemys pyrenaicus]|uniref:DBF4-type zinc finger-containing protein 2 n=1 Tax=Galemys pyrenaicus TaxID=202257 RepID=A0A8J6DU81_GALPY|nr:DBF4-type zinc finger-containing protein 2 [Galemys pyrenaicus]
MQNRQGYCSYCCVRYNNLEQHVASSQHRYLTTQTRRQMGTTSLMERFLQDVLRHHPYHYQESRSMQNERLPMNAVSQLEAVPTDNVISEEVSEDNSGVRREISAKQCEPNEELYSGSRKSQEYIQGVSVRPSVIQKLEKGRQQPLKFVHKIGSGLSEFPQVGIGQTTNNGQNSIYLSVISHAPASCLPENSDVRPLTTNTTDLPQVIHLDSISKCSPKKVDKYFEQLGRNSRNPVLSYHLETPVSYEKPEESNRRSLCISSDKLIIKEDIKSEGKTLSTDFKIHDVMDTKDSLKCEPFSKLIVNPNKSLKKTDMPSNKQVFEDAVPRYHEKLSNMDDIKEEKHLVFNKSAFLENKSLVSSEMKFGCGSLQSASDQPKGFVQDICEQGQIDQEDKNSELRSYEMSFDCNPSFHSLAEQPKVIAKEINISSKVHADFQYKNKKSCDCDGAPRLASNQIHVIVKETNLKKAMPISLVDESYESSGSEITSDCDASLQSTDDCPQQHAKVVSLSEGVHIDLVDKDYGSSSSEASADSFYPLQSVVRQLPVAVTETRLQKGHIYLVDRNYGSSCSESSFDDYVLQSVVDHPHLTFKERKDRCVYLKNENQNLSSAEAHLDCDVSLNAVIDDPQRTVEEINLLKENNNLVDINRESHGPKMHFHTDAQLVAKHFQEAVKVNSEEVATNLASKSAKSRISNLISHGFHYQPANDQPQGALDEINMKESNVDIEVKSCGYCSSDLTFDSDPPFLSVTERSELDIEEIRKECINLKDKNCDSNSSEITFDSDIPLCSVDQPQIAVYGEESITLENKRNESCISEITFDSDMCLYSRADPPKIDVKEIFQKEEYAYLGQKNDETCASKMSLDSYVSPVINPPEEAIKKLHLQKQEEVHLKNKENESSSSEVSLDDIFYSMTENSEDPTEEVDIQKEKQIHLENKANEPNISEISLKTDICLHLMTKHPDITVKGKNNQKEEHIIDKGSELSTSEINLDSDVPLISVTHKPEVVTKEIWPQKEKHANRFQDKSVEFTGSEINLFSELHYSVTESQVKKLNKEINVQKEVNIVEENKSVTCSGSEVINSSVPPLLMTKRPQIVVLKEDHVGPEEKSTEPRGLNINWDIASSLPSVIEQPQQTILKEKHIDLEDTNSKFSDCKINLYFDNPLKPLTEQFQEVANKTNLCKEKNIALENKVDENNGSKLFNSDVSLQFVADQPEVAVKRIKLENEGHLYLEGKNVRYSGSVMSLDSDFLVQSVVDQPQINILQQEHTELASKHSQSTGSEISFDSEDSVQSVADQLRETVKEISLWKDEADMEGRRDESKGFEVVHDSGVIFRSTSGRTEKVIKEIKLWKEHVALEDKTVQSSDSKINSDANEPLQFVANEIQKDITEINLLREGQVCLDVKGYETSDSEVIYVSNTSLQSVVEQPHVLEEKHATRKDERIDPCGPETSFASGDHLQSVTDHLQKDVKEISLWKEDHVYLEDKSYKLGDFEINYDSDNPVHFVTDEYPVREVNLQKKAQTDLNSKNYKSIISEIKCNSGVCLQLKVDEPQMVCKEINFQKEEHLNMEEKTSDSEIICDSDVPLHIVVDHHGVSIKEPNLQKMLFVDLVTSDDDCEMISDSDSTFQSVIDSPQMTVKEINCINTESFCLEGESHNCYSSPVGYVCEVSPGSLTNKSRETFKVVNQKKDYIILQESSCASYGSERSFQVDASLQSLTYQSQGVDKKMVKFIDLEDKSCDSDSPKKNFKWEDVSQSVIHELQKADKEVSLQKDLENTHLKDKNCKPSVSAVDWNTSPESTVHQMIDKSNFLKLKHKNLELKSCEPCSGMSFQCDPSFQSDTNQLREAVNKTDVSKMSFGWKEKNYDSHSNSVPVIDSKVNPGKTKGAIQNNLEPVLEALPHIPPSFVGKTWSQIMTEEDIKISALVKEFREGHFHCYFDDDYETRKIKKKNLNEGKNITWADINQDTTSIQVFSDYDDSTCDISDIDDFSVALDKFSHYSAVKMPYEQPWRVASRCQAVKISHGTQTNVMSHPGTKIVGEEEDSTIRMHLQKDGEKKRKVKIGKLEFLELGTHVLKPLQPNALLCVLSSNMFKLQEGNKSFSLPKKRPPSPKNNCDFNIEYTYKQDSFSSYDPLNSQIMSDPPLNVTMPEYDGDNQVHVDFDGRDLNVEDGDVDLQSFVRNESVACEWASGSSVSLEESEILNSSAAPRDSNFQFTLSNCDVAKISPKLVTNKFLESKKKIQRRKVTTDNKPGFSKMIHKPILLQQKKGIASKKQSIWIRTKPSEIIRKYISKFSVFLRHKYQSRNIFIRMSLKERSDVSSLKTVEKPASIPSSSSVPSAGPEEQLVGAIANSSPKQPVQASSSTAQRKRNGKEKCPRKKVKKPFKPVRVYALRSMCSEMSYYDRVKTRLSNNCELMR